MYSFIIILTVGVWIAKYLTKVNLENLTEFIITEHMGLVLLVGMLTLRGKMVLLRER